MQRAWLGSLIVAACAVAPVAGAAQGIPTGSTKVAGTPDSAYTHFLTFLKGRGVALVRTDSTHHRLEAKVKGSDESVLFAFIAAGDSTAVSAQGTKGGMAAMIFALGEVNEWLESQHSAATPAPKQ